MKTTKYYSSRQEHTIADYLEWSVVSGSGSRAFHPGDIVSDHYLGECKTHMGERDRICCFIDVWKKISDEATSCRKCPILFVDNGTQTVQHTWCVVPYHTICHRSCVDVIESSKCDHLFRVSETRVSFSSEMADNYVASLILPDSDTVAALRFTLGAESVVLLKLQDFRKVLMLME